MSTLSDAAVRDRNNVEGIENKAFEQDNSEEKETWKRGSRKNDDKEKTHKSCKEKFRSCKTWLTGTNFFVYCSHFLSAWGDRMWAFGVGLFLIEIASRSLRLTAIYGLSSASSYLLFGAIVGDWVDKTPRLKAAQLSLALQNIFVLCCAVVVYVHLMYETYINSQWDGWMKVLSYAVIIILAILSNLASMARTIAVEKDWIVEICGRDKDMLAQMTSTLRRIDLGTKILAPIATGQIMTYVGLEFGAVFIGGWNLVTVFIEYYLIWKVYQTVPALRKKRGIAKCDEVPEVKTEEVELGTKAEDACDAADNIKNTNDTGHTIETGETENKGHQHAASDNRAVEERPEEGSEKKDPEKPFSDLGPSNEDSEDLSNDPATKTKTTQMKKSGGCKFGKGFITLYKGWRTYLQYNVCNAGLGLAFLYMTVLGFDNITVGYAYSQHISESILGFLMAGAAIIGIIGTITYPTIRKRIGLERTGLFALSSQIACLVLCVVSVFMPGSPFDILYRTREHVDTNVNCTSAANVSSVSGYNVPNDTHSVNVTLIDGSFANSTACGEDSGSFNYTSIIMLMAGIITARFGLWTADLAITQLFLETVNEKERGIVNGVQQSLNRLMDLLKFAMVVAAPEPQLFGVLVFISFAFVCLGAVLFASYSRRARGHLFHFDKIVKCSNNNHQIHVPTDNPKV